MSQPESTQPSYGAPGPYAQLGAQTPYGQPQAVAQPYAAPAQPVAYPNDPFANRGFVAATAVPQAVPVVALLPQQTSVCCGCSKPCCANYLNYVLLLMALLAWIGCCVFFGGSLHNVEAKPQQDGIGLTSSSATFFQNHFIDFDSNKKNYEDVSLVSSCGPHGSGASAVFSLAFLTLLVVIIFISGRISNRIKTENYRRFVNYEVGLVSLSLLFYLIGIIVWANCVSTSISYGQTTFPTTTYSISTNATGYGWIIFCFILLIASLVHSITIRNDLFYTVLGRVHLLNSIVDPSVNYGVPVVPQA